MKVIQRISGKAMVVFFCFFVVTVAHAAIVWDDFSFRYAVDENSADIYNMDIDRFEPVTTRQGPTLQKTNTDGETDPVDSRVDSSSPTDPTGLNLQLNAGAGGLHISNGVWIEGYVVTSSTSGGVLFPYAVGSPGNQTVFAFSNRNFHVTRNQSAKLSGKAGGVINDPGFSSPPFLRADYNWAGGVTLEEIVIIEELPVIINSWFIDFDDLLISSPQELQISLRTQDANSDPISYTLRTVLDLDSRLLNYDFPEETQAGDIPVGALGSLGRRDAPLFIEAAMNAIMQPCEGDFDGDKDVDGKDSAQFAGGQERVALERFAEEFGRMDCL